MANISLPLGPNSFSAKCGYQETEFRAKKSARSMAVRRGTWLLAMAAAVAVPTAYARAGGPIQVSHVVAGAATFAQAGSTTSITAANNTIINYERFNIPHGNTVDFIQPSATARVLNRIIGPSPTQIDGNLNANGIVYFVNPAGVMFGQGAVINVGQLYAAAGHLSDANFLAGNNFFTDSHGSLTNAGVIHAGDVTFAAQNISNSGTIVAPHGMVVMASGTNVYVSKLGSPFVVKVAGGDAKSTGVNNSGTINAHDGDVTIRAGDMYSLAIDTSGTITAGNVSIKAAGANSTVLVSGKIDAANQGANSTGGTIRVNGGHIGIGVTADAAGNYHNAAATLNASGANGGGKILIGVKPDAASSTGYTDASGYDFIGSNASLNASATSAGNGGLVDTSGQVLNVANGAVIRAAGAGGGAAGEWLLDPYNVTISNNATVNDSPGPTFTPFATGANVLAATITSDLAGGTGVTVVTTSGTGTDAGNITIFGTADSGGAVDINPALATNVTLTLQADNAIIMDAGATIAPTTSNGSTLTVNFTADNGGTGASPNITINGNITTLGGTFSSSTAGSGIITIGATGTAINSGAGPQTYSGPVTLAADTVLKGAAVALPGGVTGATHNLTVTGAGTFSTVSGVGALLDTGNAIFNGDISTTASVDVTGTTALNSSGITTSGTQTYTGNMTLGDAGTLSGSSINLGGGVTGGSHNLTVVGTGAFGLISGLGALTETGNATFSSPVTSTTSIDVSGTTLVNTASITTVAGQTYTGAVTLGNSVTLASTGLAGTITFGSTISGADALTVEAATTSFQGNVGTGTGLTALTSLSTGGYSAGGPTTSGSTTLAGNVTTTGGQTYTGAVTLGSNDTLTTTNSAVDFVSTVDDATANAESLTISAGTGNVTFGGAVGGGASLAALTVQGTSSLGGNVTTTGVQTYNSAVTLADGGIPTTFTLLAGTNTVGFGGTVNGAHAGDATLDIGNNATVTNATFGGAVGGGASLAALTVQGTSSLGGNVTTTGGQTYNSAVTLADGGIPTTFTLLAGTNTVGFGGTVNGAHAGDATLDIGNNATVTNATFGGAVGGGASLAALTVQGTSSLGGNVTTTGGQTYNSAVTLGSNDTLTTTNSAVDFVSTVDDATANAESLTISAGTGNVTFGGAVGGGASLAALTVQGTSSLGGNVTTTGVQTYNSAVTLADGGIPTTFTLLAGTNTVGFGGTVNGAHAGDATLDIGNNATVTNATFGGAVGGGASLAALTVQGTSSLGGNVTTTGGQTYNSAVTLGSNDTLTTTNSAVDFVSTVDDATANAESLTISAGTGNVTFGGAVGGGASLAALTVQGTSSLGGNVTTTGVQTYNSAVTLADGGIPTTFTLLAGTNTVGFGGTVNGAHAGDATLDIGNNATVTNATFGGAVGGGASLAALTVQGTSSLGGNVTTTGGQTYNSAVTLGSNDTLTTTNSAVDFVSTVDDATANAESLTISAGTGNVTFGGAVGGGASLAALTVQGTSSLGGNVTTTGVQTYNSAVTLADGGIPTTFTLLAGTNTVGFGGTVNGAHAGDATLDIGNNATVTNATFGGAVGGGASLAALTVQGTSSLGGNVTTTGVQTYNSAVTLGSNDTLTTTNSAVDFVSTVDDATANAESLTISAGTGNVTFGGAVGGGASLAALTVQGTSSLGGNVTTTGVQTYNSAVTLADGGIPTTFTLLAGTNTVGFGGTVNGAHAGDATLDIGNNATVTNATFGGAVGGGASLAALTVQGTSSLGGNVTTTGGQTYNSAVTLGSNDTLTTTNSAVDFVSTVDDATANAESLTISAGTGNVTFGGAVGGGASLAALTVQGTSSLGGNVTTTGVQTYNSAVTLADGGIPTTFTLLAGTNTVGFGGTVNGAHAGDATLDIGNNATVTNATFGGAVGGGASLAALTVQGTSSLGGNVTTTGVQTYNSAVTLGSNDTLTTTNSAVDFVSTVDDATANAESLTISAGTGNVTFGGAVGGTNELASLLVTGPTSIDGGVVTTGGVQTYNSAVTLGSNDTLTTTNSAVDFVSTVDDATANAESLTISAGTGNVTFGGAVGGTNELASLLVTGPTSIDGGVVTTGGVQTYDGAVTLDQNAALTDNRAADTTGGSITFNSTIDSGTNTGSPFGLTVNTAAGTNNLTTFNGVVGNTNALASLTVDNLDPTGTIYVKAGITATGNIDLNGGADLGSITVSGKRAFVPAADVTVTGSAAPISSGLVINGDLTSTGTAGTVTLGADIPVAEVPTVATIVTTNTTGTITVTGKHVAMGQNQKWTSLTNLNIGSSGTATATLGDLNVDGKLTVNAGTVAANLRPAGSVLFANPGGTLGGPATPTPEGVDVVAEAISFTGSLSNNASYDYSIQFATPSGTASGGPRSDYIGNQEIHAYGPNVNITPSILEASASGTTYYLDLVASGPQSENFEFVPPVAPPPPTYGSVVILSGADRAILKLAGINARNPSIQNLLNLLRGQAIFNDIPTSDGMVRIYVKLADYYVTTTRLPYRQTKDFIAMFRDRFLAPVMDPKTHRQELDKTGHPIYRSQRMILHALFRKSYAAYTKAGGTNHATAVGYVAWLKKTPSQAKALRKLIELHHLLMQVNELGLTSVELRFSYNTIVTGINPAGVSRSQFEHMVMGLTQPMPKP